MWLEKNEADLLNAWEVMPKQWCHSNSCNACTAEPLSKTENNLQALRQQKCHENLEHDQALMGMNKKKQSRPLKHKRVVPVCYSIDSCALQACQTRASDGGLPLPITMQAKLTLKVTIEAHDQLFRAVGIKCAWPNILKAVQRMKCKFKKETRASNGKTAPCQFVVNTLHQRLSTVI